MNVFKRGLTLVAIVTIAPFAQAEQWAGPYFGFDVGHGHAQTETSNVGTPGNFAGVGGGAVASVAQANNLTRNYDATPKGNTFGAHLGHNWSAGKILLGLESDIQFSSLKNTTESSVVSPVEGFPGRPLTGTLRQKSKIDSLATLRGRIGYVSDQWLFYGTAGLAIARVNTRLNYQGSYRLEPAIVFDELNAGNSETRTGFVLGAGAEYAVAKNWTVRAEYLHYDLGKSSQRYDITSRVDATGFMANASALAKTDWTVNMVRIGLNYRF
jgi:outer membrane immunogenic protein